MLGNSNLILPALVSVKVVKWDNAFKELKLALRSMVPKDSILGNNHEYCSKNVLKRCLNFEG